MAFSHLPVAPTKLTISAEVGFSKRLMMMYTKVQREKAVIFLKIIQKPGLFKRINQKLKGMNKDHNDGQFLSPM